MAAVTVKPAAPNNVDAPRTLEQFLAQQREIDLLRFITCGSVDDGKSTLIGRLLHDTRQVFDDQLSAVANDSRRWGTTGEVPDLALLVDGLQAEREQGITIDVAYRYFQTPRRKFIVADCPGHEQYTRNMATGASTADAAVVLVDAEKGVRVQTRRHTHIVSLLGVQNVILAVNKMDRIAYDKARFESIAAEFVTYARKLGVQNIEVIPVAALTGMKRHSTKPRRLAKASYDSRISSKRSRSKPTRSILFTATTMRGTPSRDAMNAWRRLCVTTPCCASTRTTARSAVEAPVAMLRVYCSWPGASAMMKRRLRVSK